MNFEISLRGKLKYLNFPSYCYRIHESSLTAKLKMDNNENFDIFHKGSNLLKEKLGSETLENTRGNDLIHINDYLI